jgi:hypothetical protein
MIGSVRSAQAPSQAILDAFVRIVGADHAIRDAAAMAPYLLEPRDRYHGKAALVLKPGSTAEVSAILKHANESGAAIVPQGAWLAARSRLKPARRS